MIASSAHGFAKERVPFCLYIPVSLSFPSFLDEINRTEPLEVESDCSSAEVHTGPTWPEEKSGP